MQTASRKRAGTAIFLVGLVLGLGLAIAAIWGDFEGMSYFSSGAGYDQFGGLHCPILMGRADIATIAVAFDNPTSREIEPYYKAEVSGVAASRTLEGQVPVAPHSSRSVQWTVDANDVDLGFFIMVKIDVLPFAGNPTREATCGIIVANVAGLTGDQMLGWSLGLSLAGMVIGLGIREGSDQMAAGKDLSVRNGLRAAAVAVCLAMLTGFAGWWLIGLIFCAITILLVPILLKTAET